MVEVTGIVGDVEHVGDAVLAHVGTLQTVQCGLRHIVVDKCACLVFTVTAVAVELMRERGLAFVAHEIREAACVVVVGSPYLVGNLLGGGIQAVVFLHPFGQLLAVICR